MNYSVYTRSVEINRDLKTVANFVGKTPNLPLWTSFFLNVGKVIDGYYAVETKMGKAFTRIEPQSLNRSQQFLIQSQFGERQETAKIDLNPIVGSTALTFHMELPKHLPLEKVEQMLNALQSELYTLKNLLEETTS